MKLSVGSMVAAAYRTVFHRPWQLILAMILPLLLVVALELVLLPWHELPIWTGAASQAVDIIPYLFFGLIWFRLLLGGPYKSDLPWPLFGRRSLTYFAFSLGFYLLFVMPLIVLVVPLLLHVLDSLRSGVPGLLSPQTLVLLVMPFGIVAWGYLLGRFSLLLPATAVDEPLSIAKAWRMTVGNGLRLVAAYVLAAAPVVLILAVVAIWHGLRREAGIEPSGSREYAALYGGAYALTIAGFRLALTALLATIAADAYRHFTGGPNSQNQILMRFE